MAHTTKAELTAFWKHFNEQQHENPAVTENPDGGDGGDGAFTDNPIFDNPALRGSMKDLHVNDADTDTTKKRGVGSINLAGTREELQEQTI